MDHLSFEEANDRLNTLVQIGWASRNALRTRYTVAITPEAWEAIYWTMVWGFTTGMLVAFVTPRLGFSLICAVLILHLRPEVPGFTNR
jgi:hypothetical protein